MHNNGNISKSYGYGNVPAKGYVEVFTFAAGLVGHAESNSNVTNCFRFDKQVITIFDKVATSSNEIGESATLEKIMRYVKTNWNNLIWNFDKKLPILIVKE